MAKEATGTREWSDSSANCMNGCAYGCLYCYASDQAIRFGRKTPEDWTEEVVRESTRGKKYGKRKGRVMAPTTHDITPGSIGPTLEMLKGLLGAGNDVLVTSKPSLPMTTRLIRELDEWREQVQFRFTIGSASPERLEFWEPGAPAFHHRLSSLEVAAEARFKTSVSCEPLLDLTVVEVVRLVNMVTPYVSESIWLGQGNRMRARCKRNDGGAHSPALDKALEDLVAAWTADSLGKLHEALKDHHLVRWKVQVRKALGMA
jgi:DNA repair photolyase